ncbi:MAG TPA: MlaD family protein [Anaerohalosphaeraceae bacterium]|nr:MCE family protein [Phycisphaerae bacterium]HOK96200.1 MlaD family protein [Anaerohalosphaeraceae bacterium]HOL30583.1 MlaD family protein [Anaerohalosphaeraceae bacterium]HOM76429.1 MlaD family protein [Anaerohalosphaeraceae bacterium]HPC63596.1 MlaD family protein [Anaerohalosphaeraceae bacterium]
MTDYQTRQRQKNMVVGVFVLIALIAFLWMLFRFRDLPLAVSKIKSFVVLVYFPEAPGVQKDTPVNYCGYQIGRVMNVAPPQVYEVNGLKFHRVGVTMAIENRYTDIPKNVDIYVMKRGLGSSYIELVQDPQKTALAEGFLEDKMVLENGKVGTTSDFFPPQIQAKLENLVDSIAALADNANQIIGDQDNQTNIKKMLANIEAATAQADTTLKSIQQFSDTGNEKVRQISDKIGLAAEQLEGALSEFRQVMAKIESGQGTAGKLLNDGRLYENLIESSRELQMALQQIKEWAADAREKGIRIKW